MQALVLTEYKRLELQDVPVPEIDPTEVLIRVRSCGICGSDVHGYDGSSGRRVPPLIMGHEASGEAARVGALVSHVREGDRVTFDSMISCQRCDYCRRGRQNLCDNRRVLGVSTGEYRRHGAFAEYVSVPGHIVYRIPNGLSYDEAAMVEPVSVAVHAVSLTPVRLADSAVVIGVGMIGLLTVQALRLAGCGRIIAVDMDDNRLQQAKELGADDAIHSGREDVSAAVKALTGGHGTDIAMEAAGTTATVKMAMDSVRKGGTLTLIGNIQQTIEFPLQSAVTREIRVQGSCASVNDYPACLELIARGGMRVTPVLSATAPLADGAAMFDRLYRREPGLTKVILKP